MRSGVRFVCTNKKCRKHNKPTIRQFDFISDCLCFLCGEKLIKLGPIQKRKIDTEKIQRELAGES